MDAQLRIKKMILLGNLTKNSDFKEDQLFEIITEPIPSPYPVNPNTAKVGILIGDIEFILFNVQDYGLVDISGKRTDNTTCVAFHLLGS